MTSKLVSTNYTPDISDATEKKQSQSIVVDSLVHTTNNKTIGKFLDLPCENPYFINEVSFVFGKKAEIIAFEHSKNSTYKNVVNKKLFGENFDYKNNYRVDDLMNTRDELITAVNADFCCPLTENVLYKMLDFIMRNKWTDYATLNITHQKSRGEAGDEFRYKRYTTDIIREFARMGFKAKFTIFNYANHSLKAKAAPMMLYTFTITKNK